MVDFTEDEVRCLKKLIHRVREEEIIELYKKGQCNKLEDSKYDIVVEHQVGDKSFISKIKNFLKGKGL